MTEVFTQSSTAMFACVVCNQEFDLAVDRTECPCGGLVEVRHPRFRSDWPAVFHARRAELGLAGQSGVWRFAECVAPIGKDDIVSHPEGNTRIYHREKLSRFAGVDCLGFKHEGENPTGSFKDRGMTVAVSRAKSLGRKVLGCASTGNTSASLAAYAAHSEAMRALVFLPAGKVAAGKLAQALAYGATTVAVNGDFDRAMDLVKQASRDLGIYLVNSVNPFRIEGQKTIIWEMLEQFSWNPPDWIVVPGGNLGNTSAFGKALREAHAAGWITRLPRLAVVQATGANPFYQSFLRGFDQIAAVAADTVASAIRIGNPVNYAKARKVIQATSGVVTQVTDEEILAAKAAIDGAGLGCEPASACSLAGLRRLASEGVVRKTDSVVAILTGHVLKDADIIPKSLQYGQQQQKSLTLENSLDPLREFLKG